MVFFTTPLDKKDEVAKVRANFEKPLQELNPPGSFVTAENLEPVDRAAQESGQAEAGLPDPQTRRHACGRGAADVTGPGEEDKWYWNGLEPGIYKLRVLADRKFEQDVDLRKGERPAGQAGRRQRRDRLREGALQRRLRELSWNEAAGWRLSELACLTERQADKDRLQVIASLEQKPAPARTKEAIGQAHPRLAWFKLDGQDIQNPEALYTVKWRERTFFPAPAWQFDVAEWPRDPAGANLATPILRAWWLDPDEKLAPAAIFPMDRLRGDDAPVPSVSTATPPSPSRASGSNRTWWRSNQAGPRKSPVWS